MAAVLRRSFAVALAATTVTAVVPIAVSLAAPGAFAASSITTSPPPDGSSVVHANRPSVVATFNQTLKSGSVTLTIKGQSQNLCGAAIVSGQQVTCTPTADLDKTKTYDAIAHGTNSSGATASTSKLEFTVDYPVFVPNSSFPIPGGSEVTGGETLVGAFDEPITGDTNANAADAAFKLYEVKSDGSRGSYLPGTINFPPKSQLDSTSNGTVTLSRSLSPGTYEVVLLVNSVDSKGNRYPFAVGQADYFIYVNNTAPFQLSSPEFANNTNDKAFPLSGNAAPGLNVHVDVKNPNDRTNTGLGDATADVIVKPCPTAPSCPWTATVDLSNLAQAYQGQLSWTATGQDSNDSSTKTDPSLPGSFTLDTSAPKAPTFATPPQMSQDSTHVINVNAQDTDTSVVNYQVTITDPSGNQVVKVFAADSSHNLPPQTVDVTSLNDGTLDVLIQAMDAAGNVSAAPQSGHDFTLPKKQGVVPNLATSVLTSSVGDTTFQDAETKSVLSPTSVTLEFTQQIKLSYTDSRLNRQAPPVTHTASLCILTTSTNCVAGGSPTLTKDGYGMTVKLSQTLADGQYEVRATAFSKDNCPDLGPTDTADNCEKFSGVVALPNTGNPGTPFVFTVDSTKPTVAITSYPNPVTADNVHNVTVAGTIGSAVSSVQLLVKSSGSSTAKFLANATVDNTNRTWSAGPLDLSSLPDGTLTIKATAKKSNGLTGSTSVTAQMRAHASTLTEFASRKTVKYGRSVQITGHLSDSNGEPIANAEISVRPRFASGHYGRASTVVTDGGGAYSATFVPKHTATYYATYAGSTQSDAVTTHTARVGVRAVVVFTSPANGSNRSTPVTLKGKVAPSESGHKVLIYQHTSHGNVLLGRATLNSSSRFTFKATLPPGTDKVFAKVGKTRTNLAGKSALLTIHVS